MATLKGTALALAIAGLPHFALAQANAVIVELFTSQGCSSCPPADKVLGDLNGDDNVIPLAFHVTYWDRLGWKDTFGAEAYTQRQYAYSTAFNNRSVWTPQFVVQGQNFSRDSYGKMVDEYVDKHAKNNNGVTLQLASSGNSWRANIKADRGNVGDADILVAHYHDESEVAIKRGENAGRTLTYHNVVHAFYSAGTWDGSGEDVVDINLQAEPPFVVFVQSEGLGPILAAQVVR